MVDKVLTKHPDPNKKGVNIDREKYFQIKQAILSIIEQDGEIAFRKLLHLMDNRMQQFDGSVG